MRKIFEHKDVYRKLRRKHIIEVAIIITVTPLLYYFVNYLLFRFNVVKVFKFKGFGLLNTLTFIISSVILGSILAMVTGKAYLKPINNLIRGMEELSKGNFDTQIEEDETYFNSVIASFNALSKELKSVEILRTDFINNFSHELKTPIVSMLGLVGIMKTKEISDAKKIYYLGVIEEELNRLSFITTNILNMSKIENQNVLIDKTIFNLSEQLRRCVLIFEKAWTEKNLELEINIEEYEINGNEELLKQVWVNLLDNAIKFNQNGGKLTLNVYNRDGNLYVTIKNTGATIPQENIDKIFNKFYQVDQTYSKQGNGIGLSIVKKIVELHQGSVNVESKNGETSFIVCLPQ